MSDVGDVAQVQRSDNCSDIVCVCVHVIAVPRLARTTVPATIMSDNSAAVRREEQALVIPGVGVERPAMMEHYDVTLAPILVEDFCAVAGGDRRHSDGPSHKR
jgi:hypothetical protein